jgi:hypothetical protein
MNELDREEPGTEPKIKFGKATPDYHLVLRDTIGGAVLIMIGTGYVIYTALRYPGANILYALSFDNGLMPFAILMGFVLGSTFSFSNIRDFQNAKLLHDHGVEMSIVVCEFIAGNGRAGLSDDDMVIPYFYIRFEFFVSSTKYVIRQEIKKGLYMKHRPEAAVHVRYLPENPLISRVVLWLR